MAYIVKQKIKGKYYYYLRESRREGKKVKSISVAYLGKTRKEAEEKKKQFEEKGKQLKMQKTGKFNMQESSLEKTLEKTAKAKQEKKEFKEQQKPITIEDVANFCKRKGFVFPSSLIYGGFAGFWDFGPLGAELFNNIKQDWMRFFIQEKKNMVGIEASIISHPRTWKASGHLESFSDIAVICKKCKKSSKLDKSELEKVKCDCGGDYEVQGEFNLLFKTKVGALDSEDAYLRGETAQAMFMDFKLIAETSRQKLPFGIAQIGSCFRNEIAPRDFLFRSREFNIGEFEFFIHPDEKKCELLGKEQLDIKFRFLSAETQKKGDEKDWKLKEVKISDLLKENRLDEWHAYWLAEQIKWFYSLGLNKIKVREHTKQELSHYSSATFDIDYEYPFGSKEVAGIANRGQYDLNQHIKESKQNLEIFDEKTQKRIIPRVIEPTFGIERVFLAIITNGYYFDEERQNIVLKIPKKLAPVKVAIFPIVKTDKQLVKIAGEIFDNLKKEFRVVYDEGGSVGRRYSRNDEIGTPYCITLDDKTPKQKDVTIRNRDDKKQVRVKIADLKEILRKLIADEIEFEKAGKLLQ